MGHRVYKDTWEVPMCPWREINRNVATKQYQGQVCCHSISKRKRKGKEKEKGKKRLLVTFSSENQENLKSVFLFFKNIKRKQMPNNPSWQSCQQT